MYTCDGACEIVYTCKYCEYCIYDHDRLPKTHNILGANQGHSVSSLLPLSCTC